MSLEEKRKRLELMRVQVARKELEYKIEEKMEEISRMEAHIKTQLEKEAQLELELDKK